MLPLIQNTFMMILHGENRFMKDEEENLVMYLMLLYYYYIENIILIRTNYRLWKFLQLSSIFSCYKMIIYNDFLNIVALFCIGSSGICL